MPVSPHTKSWIIQRTVQGKTVRVTLGRIDTMPYSEAEAYITLGKLKHGENPNAAPTPPAPQDNTPI